MQKNPAAVQNAPAATLSSFVGVVANIPKPDRVTADLQGAVALILGGDPQGAVPPLSDPVGQLVGLMDGVLPPA